MKKNWDLLLTVEVIVLVVSVIIRALVFYFEILPSAETFLSLLVMALLVLVILTGILRIFAK